eukprot:Rhum_TRINITY_DN14033_c0_g1::Rhum_TRINITY_DN14033_c0_g1_i5::g.67504::m.67504
MLGSRSLSRRRRLLCLSRLARRLVPGLLGRTETGGEKDHYGLDEEQADQESTSRQGAVGGTGQALDLLHVVVHTRALRRHDVLHLLDAAQHLLHLCVDGRPVRLRKRRRRHLELVHRRRHVLLRKRLRVPAGGAGRRLLQVGPGALDDLLEARSELLEACPRVLVDVRGVHACGPLGELRDQLRHPPGPRVDHSLQVRQRRVGALRAPLRRRRLHALHLALQRGQTLLRHGEVLVEGRAHVAHRRPHVLLLRRRKLLQLRRRLLDCRTRLVVLRNGELLQLRRLLLHEHDLLRHVRRGELACVARGDGGSGVAELLQRRLGNLLDKLGHLCDLRPPLLVDVPLEELAEVQHELLQRLTQRFQAGSHELARVGDGSLGSLLAPLGRRVRQRRELFADGFQLLLRGGEVLLEHGVQFDTRHFCASFFFVLFFFSSFFFLLSTIVYRCVKPVHGPSQ